MEPKTPPSTPTYKSACPTCQETKVLEPTLYDNSDGPWELVQPEGRRKAISGTYNVTRKARDQWIQHAADVIRSEHQPEVQQAYRHDDLDLPSQVLNGLGFGQVDNFHAYLTHTYHAIPKLERPGNNVLLLLTWGTMVSGRQLGVLRDWASSQNGWNLYKLLARGVQGFQSVEQLALTMAALMNYRRLLPDFSDDSDQPIKGSYLADLDALLNGHSLGNSGTVWEQMAFALIRVLRSFIHQFEDLVTFLETVLDREPPPLHVFDGFSDQYLRWMIKGQLHEIAIAELSYFKAPELRGDDDPDWVTVTHPEELSLQELHIQDQSPRPRIDRISPALETESSMEQPQGSDPLEIDITHTIEVSTATRTTEGDITSSCIVAVSSPGDKSHPAPPSGLHVDQYTLVRLSEVEVEDEDEKVWEIFDTKIGTTLEVPNIEELGDGSWEMVVLKSHCRALQDMLGKIYPGSNVDLNYDPIKPAASDLEFLGYDNAKKLREHLFSQRAERIINWSWSTVAAYYAYRLGVMDGLREGAAGSSCLKSSHQPLVPTYRGYLQSKGDAVYLLQACFGGRLVHSCRGPRDGEVTISGNVFVWEANSTGIDSWRDGMEWTVWEQDGFEVGEAIDGSGLMKKTISIPACRAIHHVVSYYTAGDARTLARPSRSMKLSPELAFILQVRGPFRFIPSAQTSGMLVEADSCDDQLQPAQFFNLV